jgi:hypothetical protein
VAVALSLLAALAFGLGAVLQQKGTLESPLAAALAGIVLLASAKPPAADLTRSRTRPVT